MRGIGTVRPDNGQILKTVAVIAFLTCVAVSSSSTALIEGGARHDHEHDHDGPHQSCSVCAQIHAAQKLTERLGLAIHSAFFLLLCLLAVTIIFRLIAYALASFTLISFKTRMNN